MWSADHSLKYAGIEQWWSDTDRGKPKYWEKTAVPVPLCLPKIPNGLSWDRIRPFSVTEQRVTTRERERERKRESPPRGRGESVD